MSRYLNPNVALDRLRSEWEKYNSLIIAVDVDSTLIPFHSTEDSDDYEPVRDLIRELYEEGCTIIIFTAAHEDRWEGIKMNLTRYNIPFTLFNESPERIPNIHRGGKVYANAYLDDRAGLYEVYTALSTLLTERKYTKAMRTFEGITKQLSRC